MQSLTTNPSVRATQEILRKKKKKKKKPQLHPKGRTKRLCEENGVYTRSTFFTRYSFEKQEGKRHVINNAGSGEKGELEKGK